MKTAEHIIETVDKLVRKYHTRDPYELCQLLGIKIHYYDLQKKLKGFFYYQSRQKNIVIDHNVNGILERILVAHELGHAVLHTKIAMMHGFQEMEVFDDRSIEENEANFFAAELLLEDGKVLECLSEHTFFETAKMLYVPAALLDYKFSLLHEKGELVNSMYIRKADFLKEDLHAYDNDIGYGDIWISIFISLQKKSTSTMRSASWLVDFLLLKESVYCAAKKNPIAVHSVPSMGFFFIISIKLRFFYHLLLVNQDINQLSYGYQCCYITLFQFCSNLIINDAVAFCIWGIQ